MKPFPVVPSACIHRGDSTLALPLKKYSNLDGRSGSWTLAPQVRVPLSGDDEYEV